MTIEELEQQKKFVIEARKQMFEGIIANIMAGPSDIDRELNQSHNYNPPLEGQIINDAEQGTLFIPFEIRGSGREGNEENEEKDDVHRFAYSIYQLGTQTKIGVIFYERSLYGAPEDDPEAEIRTMWNGKPLATIRGDGIMYEWNMDIPALYVNWSEQERIINGMRHMHFRIGRIIETALKGQ